MSCCGEKCGCNCGTGCGGCGMYPDIEKTTATTTIAGVAPPVTIYSEGSEKSSGAEGGHGCSCNPCKCNPCNC
ncbi:hypothetical protein CsSME_00010683 [Camellia sinensis var. sinensis]